MTAHQRADQGAQTAADTPLHLVPKRPQNVPATLPQHRPQRDRVQCACECGEWFVPVNNEHKYLKGHRAARFINDKKAATFEAVWDIVFVYGGFDRALATRVAAKGVDFYFQAWMRAFEKRGARYDTKLKRWVGIKGMGL